MLTVQNWLSNNTLRLMKAGIDSARIDCLVMLEKTLQKQREWLLAHGEHLISHSKEEELNNMLSERLSHNPLAYITGYKEFYSRNFVVNPNVLIPRPESEDIIDSLLMLDRSFIENVIDVGTGSGCLAITAKLELPDIKVVASDNSENAIFIAKQNANLLGAKVEFKKSDLLKSITVNDKTVLLANLPYVPDGLITSQEIMMEPSTAIFSGEEGFDHFIEFWSQLADIKAQAITVIAESLINQHVKMMELAKKSGFNLIRKKGLVQVFLRA